MPLLIGLIVGVLMCIPIGPINIWVVNTQLKRGRGPAVAIVLGSCLMDVLYFVALSSGISLLPIDDGTALVLKAIGIVVLMALGLKELLWAKMPSLVVDGAKEPPEPKNLWGFFLFGVLIYASNPTLVATLTALTAMIRSWNLFTPGMANHVLLGIGAGLGSALWFFTLLSAVRRYQHMLQGRALLWATRACGVLILLAALWMGFQLAQQVRDLGEVAQSERLD